MSVKVFESRLRYDTERAQFVREPAYEVTGISSFDEWEAQCREWSIVRPLTLALSGVELGPTERLYLRYDPTNDVPGAEHWSSYHIVEVDGNGGRCWTCDDEHTVDCHACNGTGEGATERQRCYTCKGRGALACPECRPNMCPSPLNPYNWR